MPLMPAKGSGVLSVDLEQAWVRLCGKGRLAHVATVSSNGAPHINACYFALADADSLTILTPPSAEHSRNFQANPICGVAISLIPERLGDKICGAQLECAARMLDNTQSLPAYEAYVRKFPEFSALAPTFKFVLDNFQSRFFVLEVKSGKLIDEEKFGREAYIHFATTGNAGL